MSTTPVQATPTQIDENGSAVPTLFAQEPKKDDTQITQSPTLFNLEILIAKAKENLAQYLAIRWPKSD